MHVYSCTCVCICQHNQVFHPDNEAPTGGLSLIAALNFNPPQEVGYTHTHTQSWSVADSQWIFVGDTMAARFFAA